MARCRALISGTYSYMKAIVASTCTFEPQHASHAPEMFSVLSDPAIYEFESEAPVDLDGLTKRFESLESRVSPDCSEQWLNWVIHVDSGVLVGYVQATVNTDRTAHFVYELNSQYWRRGFGSSAVLARMQELRANYGVTTMFAVLKARNYRSLALLQKLGFVPAEAPVAAELRDDADEVVMVHKEPDGFTSDCIRSRIDTSAGT